MNLDLNLVPLPALEPEPNGFSSSVRSFYMGRLFPIGLVTLAMPPFLGMQTGRCRRRLSPSCPRGYKAACVLTARSCPAAEAA